MFIQIDVTVVVIMILVVRVLGINTIKIINNQLF